MKFKKLTVENNNISENTVCDLAIIIIYLKLVVQFDFFYSCNRGALLS